MGALASLLRRVTRHERRLEPRWRIALPLVVRHRRFDAPLRAQTIDANTTAVAFYADVRPPMGDTVDLELALTGDSVPLICCAQVIRCEPASAGCEEAFRVAVAFSDLEPADEERLLRTLREHGKPA